MPIVTWRDEYNVNVAVIDSQHQKMLELVNNLHTAVEARIKKDDLKDMLVELVEFTRMHFSTEEQLMKEHGYPGLGQHQELPGKGNAIQFNHDGAIHDTNCEDELRQPGYASVAKAQHLLGFDREKSPFGHFDAGKA